MVLTYDLTALPLRLIPGTDGDFACRLRDRLYARFASAAVIVAAPPRPAEAW